ncbi:hypothetical protein C3F09_08390 [candidate division GN15 bacterium]|uniref:Apea-like HEPN domain-containing protein n=1 Tax=candidate division GN15 bacterium TaxID=2072418 RepID=A0A855X5P7_9BACT|nr:MAG: hypothetical protein C3F09_08390 [candidate division GN15 bacterium]
MELTDRDKTVIAHFADALKAAKVAANNEDEFWTFAALNPAFDKLARHFELRLGEAVLGTRWELFSELGYFGERVSKGNVDLSRIPEVLPPLIQSALRKIRPDRQWVAIVPLERRFASLPAVFECRLFYLLNPLCGGQSKHKWAELLSDRLKSTFVTSSEMFEKDRPRYIELLDWQMSKSLGNRRNPVMVIPLKCGTEHGNRRLAEEVIPGCYGLINFVHLICRMSRQTTDIWPAKRRFSDAKYFDISGGLLASLNYSESVEVLRNPYGALEDRNENDIDFDCFGRTWNTYGAPLASLAAEGAGGMILERLKNSVQMLSKCRYSDFTDLTLSSVIASEAILNPFNEKDNLTERYALFGATLLSEDLENRKHLYRNLKSLYSHRSTLVHTAKVKASLDLKQFPTGSAEESLSHSWREDGIVAFDYFVRFYLRIIDWLTCYVAAHSEPTNNEIHTAFQEFYLESILKPHNTQ